MKYFKTLPTILQPDPFGNYITVTNIIARGYLVSSLKDNLNLYYQYNIKDFDRPETISYKYYNDQYRYWLVLYANGIFDPQWDWPLNYYDFSVYINDKYASEGIKLGMSGSAYALATIHHYEQTVTTFNDVDPNKLSVTIEIDEPTYANTITYTKSISFPDGSEVTKQVSKREVSIYEYEVAVNQNKAQIQLIKDSYVTGLEAQLSSIMGT